MTNDNYTAKSLELHLFFARIMKEHALFLKAGFTPANPEWANRAEFFKNEFEKLLSRTVALSGGNTSENVLQSGEIVTEFTLPAERQTENLTGITIDKSITQRELHLVENSRRTEARSGIRNRVKQINRRAIELLWGLIRFKENVLNNVLDCKMFTANYPLLIEHIIREAKLYLEYVNELEKSGDLSDKSMRDTECFWNQIMMEHAFFIRGLLDPTESQLIEEADDFAGKYSKLLEACSSAQNKTIASSSLEETIKFRDFKTAGVKGIENCEIRSLILPLLADHVLREANHYIRLLKTED